MMETETERLADQIRRSVRGGAWHGPSILEALRGVEASRAAAKPLETFPSLWAYALHCLRWMRWTRERLQSESDEKARTLSAEEDWAPPAATDEAAWQATIAELENECAALVQAVSVFPSEDLERLAPGLEYSVALMLGGVAQHNAYHAGQMMALRRAAGWR